MEDNLRQACLLVKEFIKDLGFPIFVAIWMMVVSERSMKKLTAAINSLTGAFERANIRAKPKKEGGDI